MPRRKNKSMHTESVLSLPFESVGQTTSCAMLPGMMDRPGDGPGPDAGLRLYLDAREVAALTRNLDTTLERFNRAKSHLEAKVAKRTRELEQIRERLEVVIDSIADGIIACSEQGVVKSFNRAAESLFGCLEAQAVGKSVKRFFPRGAVSRGLFSELGEARARRFDGLPILVEGTVRPMQAPEGTLYVIAVRDLTAVRMTQKRLKEQAFLIQKSKSFVLTLDTAQRVVWCNPCFEKLSGYALSSMLGRRPGEFLFDRDSPAKAVAAIDAAFIAGTSFSEEIILRHANGRPFWVQIEAHPMHGEDGSVEKWVALGLDITARKREEQQHVDFVSMVSHELRTPLTVVSGSFDALAMGVGGDLPEVCHSLIEMGQRNCAHLSTLIEDLLDINKLEAGVIRFQSEVIDIVAPVGDAARSMLPLLRDRAIKLESDVRVEGARVFVDPNRLRQVIINLLSNAIKFSPIGGRVILSIELIAGMVRVTVQDFGHGIPASFQPRLFEKFSRDVAVQASGKEGFGLGLCISKGLVAQMGGRISFVSQEGEGSSFIVDLPLHSQVIKPAQPAAMASDAVHA